MPSTCQICARAIRANTGLIAHHGYRRPYPHLQTNSCFGARRRPYEVAHDALDEYLGLLVGWLAEAERSLAAFRASPPDHLTFRYQRDAWDEGKLISVERPQGFDPDHLGPITPRNYAALYVSGLRDRERQVRDLAADRKELTARRAAWKEAA